MFFTHCNPAKTFKAITEQDFVGEGQPENNIDQDEDDYLRNPLQQNEHVGVDEETKYMESEPMDALDVAGCFEKENEDEDELKDDSEFKDLEDEVEADEEQKCEDYCRNFNRGGQKALTEVGKPTASVKRSRLIMALTEAVVTIQPPRLIHINRGSFLNQPTLVRRRLLLNACLR